MQTNSIHNEPLPAGDAAGDRRLDWAPIVPLHPAYESPRSPQTLRTSETGKKDPIRRLCSADFLSVLAAWILAYAGALAGGTEHIGRVLVRAAVLAGFSHLVASHARLYDTVTISERRIETASFLRVCFGTGLLALAAPMFTHGSTNVVRALVGTGLSVFFVGTWRFLLHAWVRNERAAGRHLRAVAVVAYREEADRLIELLASRPDLGLRVTALAGDWETAFKHNLVWLGWPSDVPGRLAEERIAGAVISPLGMEAKEYNDCAQALAVGGFETYFSTGLEGVGHGRLRQAALGNESFYSLVPAELTAVQSLTKRALDLVVAGFVIALTVPLMLAIALGIKLFDRGPIFFQQVRVGRDGKPFTLLKFRTMVVDAEARLAELKAQNARGGPLFKVVRDPRVTPIGRILRATSLDELPQLFNVLSGTMSLVGPRPALPSEVATFDERHLERHRVAPGVTGLWQIEARDNPSFKAYRDLDLFYVDNWSCGLDLVILWSTLPTVVARAARSLLDREEITASPEPASGNATSPTPPAPAADAEAALPAGA